MEIFYRKGEEVFGPVSRAEFVQLLHSGVIKPDTLISTISASEGWKPYSEAYNDLFPSRRVEAEIPQLTEGLGTSVASTQEHDDADGGFGFVASIIAFYSLYRFWVHTAVVLVVLFFAGSYFSKHREAWFEDAVTMKDKDFDVGETKSALKKARKAWRKASRHLERDAESEALNAYAEGYRHVRFAYEFHRDTTLEDGKRVGDFVREAAAPLNEALNQKHRELMDRYELGQVYSSELRGMMSRFGMVVFNDLNRNFEQRRGQLDTSRAAIANSIYRIEFHPLTSAYFDDEDPRYGKLQQQLESVVRARFRAPEGYRMDSGPPVGPKEKAATYFSSNLRMYVTLVPYYFVDGRLVADYVGRYERLKPDGVVPYEMTVTVLDPEDRDRLQARGLVSTWDRPEMMEIGVRPALKIEITSEGGEPERILRVARYAEEAIALLGAKVETEFPLKELGVKPVGKPQVSRLADDATPVL